MTVPGILLITPNFTTNSNGFCKDLAYGNLRNSADRDLVTVYENRTEVMWNINNSLSLQQNNLPGGEFLSLGKITNDDFDDLALYTGSEIKIFRNNGSGSFLTSPIQTIYEQPVYMQLVDLQYTKSFYDLVTLVYEEEESGLLKIRNNVSGQFGSPTTINLGENVERVIMGDVNYDDYPDLVVVRRDGKLRIYINQEGNIPSVYTYEVINNDFFDYYIEPIAIGDMNNDGWNDIVITRIEGWVGIWINQKSGNLFNSEPQQIIEYFLPYSQNHTLKLADIENTGGLSVIFTNNGGIMGGEYSALHVFKHNGNPPPAPPKNLSLTGLPGDHPTIKWDPNQERDMDHYEIWRYRHLYDDDYQLIASNVSEIYYTDYEITIAQPGQQPTGGVYYKIKAVDNVGNKSDFSNTVSTLEPGVTPKSIDVFNIEKNILPTTLSLIGNYPNPFNPTTTIVFGLPEAQKITLTIYNVQGKKVTELVNGVMKAGFHRVIWNGCNTLGQKVSSGIYIYELRAGDKRLVKKMLLTK